MLIKKAQATLFAGCGIVGSESLTMPHPANNVACAFLISIERIATINSQSSYKVHTNDECIRSRYEWEIIKQL
jgi:hypothetical protein